MNRPVMSGKGASLASKQRVINYTDPNGGTTKTFYKEGASVGEVAEQMCRDVGGRNWPHQINGGGWEDFDLGAQHDVCEVGWIATSPSEMAQNKQLVQQAISQKGDRKGDRKGPGASTAPHRRQPPKADESLVVQFTESRAAAVEAEFGQLILSCLGEIEDTVDTLIEKKVELIKERARIEATIRVLEERIDEFKQKADTIIEAVDPFEQDIAKLGYE